jgi:hypothetical protein
VAKRYHPLPQLCKEPTRGNTNRGDQDICFLSRQSLDEGDRYLSGEIARENIDVALPSFNKSVLLKLNDKPTVRPFNADVGQESREERRHIQKPQRGDRLTMLRVYLNEVPVITDHHVL